MHEGTAALGVGDNGDKLTARRSPAAQSALVAIGIQIIAETFQAIKFFLG